MSHSDASAGKLVPWRYGDPVTPAQVIVMVMETMQYCRKSIEDALVGRHVRVMSDHNGQPYGRSRKSWRDQICEIRAVHIDLYNTDCPVQLRLASHEYECFIPANEVQFT